MKVAAIFFAQRPFAEARVHELRMRQWIRCRHLRALHQTALRQREHRAAAGRTDPLIMFDAVIDFVAIT